MPTDPSVVTIPLSLAIPLFECYFGTGPRRAESLAAVRDIPPPPPPTPPTDPLLPPTAVLAPNLPGGWVPRGAARPVRPATMTTSGNGPPPPAES